MAFEDEGISRNLDDTLSIKLSIEPTALTEESIKELSRKAEEVTVSLARVQSL